MRRLSVGLSLAVMLLLVGTSSAAATTFPFNGQTVTYTDPDGTAYYQLSSVVYNACGCSWSVTISWTGGHWEADYDNQAVTYSVDGTRYTWWNVQYTVCGCSWTAQLRLA